jgi:hypothetical protein
MSALLSFFGGTAFRMIWGEISAYYSRKQEQAMEIERMKVQGELDAAQHARNMESQRLQADLGVKIIQVQAEADTTRLEVGAWAEAVAAVGRKTGVYWIDAWNGAIRPMLATVAMVMIVSEICKLGFNMSDWHRDLFSAILGIYVADRSLGKRGK